MSATPVVYEVNLSIAKQREAEFDTWLGEHVAQMLNLPGFLGATTLIEERDDATTVGRSVHYQVRDNEALQTYFDEHAERMRAIGVARFGDDLSATRRTFSAQPATSAEACANCASALAGQYCGTCGQRHRTRMISVFELTRDVFEDIFRWDSRVWRSLRPLLLSPGKLTNEYLDGRRTYYTPPLRMYFVLSIAFFLLTSLPAFEDFNAAGMLGVSSDENGTDLTFSKANLPAEADEEDGVTVVIGDPQSDADPTDPSIIEQEEIDEEDCDITLDEINIPGISQEALEKRVRELCLRGTTPEGRRAFSNEFADIAPKLLIIMLPIIALASKMMYPLSRRYYVEHLLFYTHFHSFAFFLLLLIMLVTTIGARLPFLSINTTLLGVAGGLYGVFYLYRAMRRVFRQGRLATLFKLFLVWLSYTIGTTLLTVIGAAIAALSI
ncbi:MAG: DUF4286 family protein [Gammaproteobacteria bacterium]